MYAQKTDIENLYTAQLVEQLVERDEDIAPDVLVDDAITQATSEINSYLSVRYVTPLTVVPPFIRRACIDITVYVLAQPANLMTDEISDRYKRAIAHLKDIVANRANVPDAQPIGDREPENDGSDNVMFAGDDRLFTRSSTGDL